MNNTKGKYTMRHHVRHALCALTALLLLLGGMAGARAQTWTDVDIGSPPVAGSSSYNNGVLTVNGSGTGDTTNGTDQLHFTYQNNAGGNVEIIARMTSFTNASAHARAGIMVRTSNNASAVTTANEVLAYQDAADGNNNIVFTARDQASGTCSTEWRGNADAISALAALRSASARISPSINPRTACIWSALGNTSGWQFTPSGAIEVGFFVSSDGVTSNATATFDNITIGTPNMGYSTSWVGNTFGGRVAGWACLQ